MARSRGQLQVVPPTCPKSRHLGHLLCDGQCPRSRLMPSPLRCYPARRRLPAQSASITSTTVTAPQSQRYAATCVVPCFNQTGYMMISVPAGGDAYVPKRVLMDWRRGGKIGSPIWCSITALYRGAIIDMADALNGRNVDTSESRISVMVCVTCPHN
jgi:hypothetical protein